MSERINMVVVGASAAGLSAAHYLSREGVEHVLLEKEERAVSAWRDHYERLHLHTSKPLWALPYRKWGGEAESYPSRLDVVKYLEAYAEDLKVNRALVRASSASNATATTGERRPRTPSTSPTAKAPHPRTRVKLGACVIGG